MCLIKTELSKITYSFQNLFKLEQKLLLVCFFAIFPMKDSLLMLGSPSSSILHCKWERPRPQGEEHFI